MSEKTADQDNEQTVSAAEITGRPNVDGEGVDDLGTRQRGTRRSGSSVYSALRWGWFTLTSMRTALILLFLLALAAVPGSVFPQRGNNPIAVSNFYRAHTFWAPFLNHLGAFDVFGSAWFAAIYLLLFISLAGCVIPRSRRHFHAMRARPPAAPRNMTRLPLSVRWETDAEPAAALEAAQRLLKSRRFRADRSPTSVDAGSVNAEKGHLRETGNLLFHLSLLVVLIGIAISSVFGFTGTVLVKEHDGFADTQIDYDSLAPGRFVNVAKLPPFSFTLNSFNATYQRTGSERGEATTFDADVTWAPNLTAAPRAYDIRVNHPLSSGGANIYLVGHGYAPRFIIKDGKGHTFDDYTPFLPQNSEFLSQGVVKLPDASPQQLGITGFFLPTAELDPTTGQPVSTFPAPDNPAVVIGIFAGDLGLSSGQAQSVYTLDTTSMKLITSLPMAVGDSYTLPNGLGSITFAGYEQWATFQIGRDPGKKIVLVAVGAVVLGLVLSLRIRRRRLWVRAVPGSGGRTVVDVGGLTRTDASGGFDEEFATLVGQLRVAIPPAAEVEQAPVVDRPVAEEE
jgi:cytochrome c biogenesis protein